MPLEPRTRLLVKSRGCTFSFQFPPFLLLFSQMQPHALPLSLRFPLLSPLPVSVEPTYSTATNPHRADTPPRNRLHLSPFDFSCSRPSFSQSNPPALSQQTHTKRTLLHAASSSSHCSTTTKSHLLSHTLHSLLLPSQSHSNRPFLVSAPLANGRSRPLVVLLHTHMRPAGSLFLCFALYCSTRTQATPSPPLFNVKPCAEPYLTHTSSCASLHAVAPSSFSLRSLTLSLSYRDKQQYSQLSLSLSTQPNRTLHSSFSQIPLSLTSTLPHFLSLESHAPKKGGGEQEKSSSHSHLKICHCIDLHVLTLICVPPPRLVCHNLDSYEKV